MNIAGVPVIALVLALVSPSSVGASRAGIRLTEDLEQGVSRAVAGIVEGTVQLHAVEDAPPPMLSPYSRRQYRPPTPAPRTAGSAAAVVVYLIGERPSVTTSSTAVITQRDRTILPHVTVVQSGTRINFPNEDEVFHNLFSLSAIRPFNLGRYAPGDSRTVAFGKAGVVKMFCDIHAEMAGIIVVVDTPYFTKPDAAGRYRLTGVPDGRYRIVAWHDSAGADTAAVTVRSGAVTRADFQLGG